MKLYRILLLSFITATLIACGGAEERKAVYLEKAKSSIAVGDLDKARIELKNVLQIDPKDGDAYFQLGKVYEQQNEYRKAYSNYLKAEELKPELLQNQARLGRFYLLLMNDTDKAQEKIDLILSKEPDNSDGLLLQAAVMVRKNDTAEAINIAKAIIAQDPEHVESVMFLASLYAKDKKRIEAIKVLDDSISNNANNEMLNKLLASILVANKNYERAETLYKGFLERNPDNSSSYNNLAAFYNLINNKPKAEEILHASVNNDPTNENRILTLIKYINTTRSDDSIKELESYISANKSLGKLRLALAELLILNDDKKSATEVLKQTINDFSEEVTGITARTALASIYVSDKDYDNATQVVEDAILISPNDPQVNYLRAKFAVRDKDLEKAIISLRIVTIEMPENIDAFILLANIYKEKDNNEQVKSTLNSAYENNRINADALLKLAKYYSSIDISQSEKIINEYNSLRKKDYEGLTIKAAILNKNKEHEEAYKIAQELMLSFSDRPNGYLQAVPYLSEKSDKGKIISILESGYINAEDNRKLLIMLTTIQISEGKFDIVENRIKEEIKLSPDEVELNMLLAKVYIAKKDMKSATVRLNDIIKSNPEVEQPYLLLSQIHKKNNDSGSVKTILTKGKANVPFSVQIPLRLAMAYESDNEFNKAINLYRELHDSNPDNLIIINNLASMLSEHGDGNEDLKLAKTFSEKLEESGQPIFLDTIGWIYYKMADYQGAIRYLSQVTEWAPKVNVFNYHLGMAYKMAGDKVMAKIYLEKSLADGKAFKEENLAKVALRDL